MSSADLPCELVSWPRFAALARRLALKIDAAGFRPDLIVAIARGGYAPARVLADALGVMNLASIKVEHYHGPRQARRARVKHALPAGVHGRRVLLVDDISDSGDTFAVAIPHLAERLPGAEIRTAVLLHKAVCPQTPDYYARKVLKWRWVIFPWAAVEDLSALLRAAGPDIQNPAALATWLAARHGLRPARGLLDDVIALNKYWIKTG